MIDLSKSFSVLFIKCNVSFLTWFLKGIFYPQEQSYYSFHTIDS